MPATPSEYLISLSNLQAVILVCFLSFRGPNVPPGYSCFRPVRRKAYWVLFGGKSHVVVMEHVAYPGNIGVHSEPVACTPISLSGNVSLCYGVHNFFFI